MNHDPEFMMPDPPPQSSLQESELSVTPEASINPPVEAAPSLDGEHHHKHVAAGVLVGAVIGAVIVTASQQAVRSGDQPDTRPESQQQGTSLGGIGDAGVSEPGADELDRIEAPIAAQILSVTSRPTLDTVAVQFEVKSTLNGNAYRLVATQERAEVVSENQAVSKELGSRRTTAEAGDVLTMNIPLDLSGTHPSLPYHVTLSSYEPSGALKELDAVKILLSPNCEPTSNTNGDAIYCWNPQ